MIRQIEMQNEIVKGVKILIDKGNNFCADCNEAHLCNGCRLNAMLISLTLFIEVY